MKSHAAHIVPLKAYLAVAAALLLLTGLTVGVALIDFKALLGVGHLNVVIAMLIATFKAALVGLIFMHLLWDNRLYALIFFTALLILGIFAGLTLFDTLRRGEISPIEERPIQPQIQMPSTPPG